MMLLRFSHASWGALPGVRHLADIEAVARIARRLQAPVRAAHREWAWFLCAATCIVARVGCIWLPLARVEIGLAAASVAAAAILADAWLRDSEDLGSGGVRALAVAAACALGSWFGF
jgi:hypothetical protein